MVKTTVCVSYVTVVLVHKKGLLTWCKEDMPKVALVLQALSFENACCVTNSTRYSGLL